VNDDERIRLYASAFDAGVTHFDTARVYGLGGAEKLLGRFIADKRDRVTVTTKLGVLPPPHRSRLRLAKAMVRGVEKVLPGVASKAKQHAASRLTQGGHFSADDARSSLETSLREMNTDHVDVLLLHECRPGEVSPELLEFLDACISDGTARCTGIATDPSSTASFLRNDNSFPQVVQVANSATDTVLDRLDVGARAVITHSAVGRSLEQLAPLVAKASPVATWSQQLHVDCSDARNIAGLLLRYAVAHNKDGVVLFYSSKLDNVSADVAAATGGSLSDEQAELFAELVRDALRPSLTWREN
jgi:diketogulonate reductase-like aldo/keto reductase